MDGSELSDSEKDDKEKTSGGAKMKRSVEALLKEMKLTDDEINYRLENFDAEDVSQYLEYLKCTKCNHSFQKIISMGKSIGVHPLLGVLFCDSCSDYYGDGNFSLDSDGDDKYCRWCGEGGTIFVCSKCICGFCDKCIKKHFGGETLNKVKSDDDWICYFCNPKPLWDLRYYCFLAEQTSKNKRADVKKKKVTNSRSKKKKDWDDSSSESCGSISNSTTPRQSKRKKFSKKRKQSSSASSEEGKENEVASARKSRVQRRKQKVKTGDEDSEGSDGKNPKKKLKIVKRESEESRPEAGDPELDQKRARVLKKFETVWKFAETITSAGLSSCRTRLRKLANEGRILSMESLAKEHEHLEKFMGALLSSLNAAFNSVSAIREDLTVDSAGEEREIFRSREMELKSIAKMMEEEPEGERRDDSKGGSNAPEKSKPATAVMSNQGKERQSEKSGGKESRNLVSEPGSENEKEKEEKDRGCDSGKPLLKVKSFARMFDENVLEGTPEGNSKTENGGTDDTALEYEVETDENTDTECGNKNEEKPEKTEEPEGENKKDGSELGEETTVTRVEIKEKSDIEVLSSADEKKKKVNSDSQKKKSTDESGSEEEDGTRLTRNNAKKKSSLVDEGEEKKKMTEESDSEEERRVTRKKTKEKSGIKASFEKFKRKRERFLKAAKENSEKVEEKPEEEKEVAPIVVLESSESEVEKEGKHKRGRPRKKCVIASSDEEGKEGEKKPESEEESKESDAESSSESDKGKKESNWRRIRKEEEESSASEAKISAADTDSSDGEKKKNKKKGRKNIKKILKKDSLHVETKEALKNEEERKKRVRERRKLFKEMFPEEKENEFILDFDPETKEPLVTVHKKLVKKLKPHQKEGVRFMWDNCFESVKRLEEDGGSGCILAHCMGLGKTLQVITLVHTIMNHDLGVNTVLIVCPLSTVSNWLREFETWLENIHTDPITLYDLVKYKKREERIFHLQNWHNLGGVLVISYDLFRNLTKDIVKSTKKLKKSRVIETALLDPGPDLVVCDEGHLLKNEDTALSKCMSKVKTSRRIVLTGTPLQNNLLEYHCMVQFVKPNILGTKKEFCNRFVNPISNGQFEDSTEYDVKVMKRRSHVLHSMLDGCIQRFDYSVLTPFLPEKYEYVLSISLTETQAKAYQHFISTLSAKSMGSSKAASLFNDFHNLQRIWTHPKTMLMQSDKEMRRKEKESEDSEGSLKDFVVSSDEETTEPSSDSSSEKAPPKRKRLLRSNANDPEMMKAEEEEIQEVIKHWWDDFYKERDYEDLRESHKLMILFSLLKYCGEVKDKVLVFSQSLYSLDLIEYFLAKIDENSKKDDELLCGHQDSWVLGADYFRLDGTTSSEMRAMWCRHFNKPSNTRGRLFLISTRAGGLGINLYGANRVVIFDASWNPSHDVQSIFRVYRFGQKKTCYIYRFLAEATMEEKIYERQVTKLSLAHRVVDEHQIERHYSMMNLQELYNFEPTPKEKRKVPKLPKDRILADLLTAHKDIIVGYHEHDSLLENREEEELSEEERKAAWKEYEEEKVQKTNTSNMEFYQQQLLAMQQMAAQNAGAAGVRMLNPAFIVGQANIPQNFSTTGFIPLNIPINILQRGIQVGLTPFFNESTESFFNRVIHREKWVQMNKGPREA